MFGSENRSVTPPIHDKPQSHLPNPCPCPCPVRPDPDRVTGTGTGAGTTGEIGRGDV